MKQHGPLNLITDIEGLLVGNAQDDNLKSGVTAVICEGGATAAVQILGGAPGTRETDLLEPHNTVETVDAVVLSGGSAFGLDAGSGVQAALHEKGIGFEIGPHRIPLVPTAILFDLTNGGDKDWGRFSPYRDLGYEAANCADRHFQSGTAGAGTGALTAGFKGGLGSASLKMGDGTTVGALVAVNSMGTVNVAGGPHFWAAPFELNAEFGGLGFPTPIPESATDLRIKFRDPESRQQMLERANTTIAVIATDAVLSKAAAKRLAIAAHDGFSRAIWPAHTPSDGDLVFTIATGKSGIQPDAGAFIDLCAGAAAVMSRAIARGVYGAVPADNDLMPAWQSKFANSAQ
jgi:L-aminopeptidase/D-esterase-like protein